MAVGSFIPWDASCGGEGYLAIEEALNGRTTMWDDRTQGYKNGRKYRILCLETHRSGRADAGAQRSKEVLLYVCD